MTDHLEHVTPGPYATAAPTYWAAGWRGILPLPANAKTPVPRGYTGTTGGWPSYPDITAWTEDQGAGNIALRLPPDVLGVDVDHYGNKPGFAVLQDLEQRLGALPATWRTTSRDDGVSGIRLYRIPAGLRWPGVLGPGIETIRHEHRYAVAWPSVHPQGGTYRWITPDGATTLGVVPSIDDLPDLPAAWIEHFTHGELATEQARTDLTGTAAHQWITGRDAGALPPCAHMDRALQRGLADMTGATSRHDTMLQLTNRLVWLVGEGHVGGPDALTAAQRTFLSAVAGDRDLTEAAAEFDRMVTGAVRMAAAAHPEPSTDPCQSPLAGLIAPRQDEPWTSFAASGPPSPLLTAPSAVVPAGTTTPPTPAPSAAATDGPSTAEPAQVARTSWWPRDLRPALTGENPEPEPEHLVRDDGQALFYPAKVNGLIGPSESGKTWVALLAVQQAVVAEQNVTILDFEDSDTGLVTRLLDLGLDADQIAQHVAYIGPDEMLGLAGQADLLEHLGIHTPALIVLDGFNAAMTLLGLDLMSNTDATRFAQIVLKPLAKTGAAVVYIDHTPKDTENKSSGGIGAQAKRAMTTGCAIRVEVVKQFGKGQEGKLRLRVDKDRPGYVRGASLPGKAGHWAADAVITPTADGTVDLQLKAPQDTRSDSAPGHEDFRPTALMRVVSTHLASLDEPASKAQILANVTGKEKYVVLALETLVAEGYATSEVVGGRGGAHPKYSYAKAYTETSDLIADSTSATSARASAHLRPGAGSTSAHGTSAPPPSPSGGAGGGPSEVSRPGASPMERTSARIVERVVGGERVIFNLDTGEIVDPEASA
jgi:hypothetical protein